MSRQLPIRLGGFSATPFHDAQSPWIARPWIDVLIGCGGWSAPLLLFSYTLLDSDARRWSAVFYALALVCNYPHYMATLHRAYGRRDDRSRHRVFTHHLTVLLVLIGVAAHAQPVLLPWVFTLYVMWSPWHYTGQNFGVSMMFLRRAGVDVRPGERRWLRAAYIASYVMLLAAFNQGASHDRVVLSLDLPLALTGTVQAVASLVFVLGGALTFLAIAQRTHRTGLVAPLTLYSTQALWFVLPIALTWIAWAPVPQTRYSTGILAVMHSAQYLWITQHFARRDAARRGSSDAWSHRAYWAMLIIGGLALFVPVPWLASYAGHFDFTSSALIVTAIVNIHHFLIDGVVWKLRDPRVSQALVGHETAPSASSSVPSASSPALASSAPPAILLSSVSSASPAVPVLSASSAARAVAVAALVALALVDQWRYLLAFGESDVEKLQVARSLNPHDSAVHLRIAAEASRSGDRGAAERALLRAIDANPNDPTPYLAREQFLIESGRMAEAYAHCQTFLARWPNEVDTLVNAGVLAERLGDRPGAERWWRRALEEQPGLAHVQLYLAELLDGAGRIDESVVHYRRYLDLVSQQTEPRPEPRQVSLVVIKFGDALRRAGQADVAATQYDLARRIAQQTGLADVEALAHERLTRAP